MRDFFLIFRKTLRKKGTTVLTFSYISITNNHKGGFRADKITHRTANNHAFVVHYRFY